MSLSLYIHFPFCTNLCYYCDFYKTSHSPVKAAEYIRVLADEIALVGGGLERGSGRVESIYIGGGTPSLLDPSDLEKLVSTIKKYFSLESNLEFSLEINPESIDVDRLAAFQTLGVNRPVFGIQSFEPKALKRLGRKHNLHDTYRAVYLTRALGFANFGVDMIFGLPGQTGQVLSRELAQLAELAPPHISYYQLTVEKGTRLDEQISAGKIKLPESDLCAAMYRAIAEDLKLRGYTRYEVSSFARPGFECRHNLRYWEGGEYLGLGPSAHSYIGGQRFFNLSNLEKYIKAVRQGQRPVQFDTRDSQARMAETIMLGLRTLRGIDRRSFRKIYGRQVEETVNQEIYRRMIEMGFIDPEGEHIRLTETGLPLADEIIRRLVE